MRQIQEKERRFQCFNMTVTPIKESLPKLMVLKQYPLRTSAVLFFMVLLTIVCHSSHIYAASPVTTINGIGINDVNSLKNLSQALSLISSTLSKELSAGKTPSFDFQKAVLTKSGECVTALVSINGNISQMTSGTRREKTALFLKNRDSIRQILNLNEKIIFDYQENKLDKMSDPIAFFQSDKWQNPQFLISLASYWIGWNNYYTTLFLDEGDNEKAKLLEEAIKGFTRAFVDFDEDSVVARSLFGRGLCYRQNKAYAKAIQDLELVKQKVDKEDSLHMRCAYEVAWILYETGKSKEALKRLDGMRSDYTAQKIPDEIQTGMDAIRSKILISLAQHPRGAKATETKGAAVGDELYIFNEMKKMSSTYNGANELYRYAREHGDRLQKRSPAELGPIGAIAVGDLLFDEKKPDAALDFYLPYYKERHVFLNDRMDGIWFRIAYTYCKKQQWDNAIVFLEPFAKRFPASSLISEISSLYYVAASGSYANTKSDTAHTRYIDAIRLYLNRCKGPCPYKSEAYFQLGKHYQKIGQGDRAAQQFKRVGEDSPNRFAAKYYELQYCVETLASLRKAGKKDSDAWKKTYEDGTKCINAYRSMASKHGDDKGVKSIAATMVILSADLLHYGNDTAVNEAMKTLDGFETRYPKDKRLLLKAMILRLTCLSRLGSVGRAETEINRFIEEKPLDSDRVGALHEVADAFYRDAERLSAKAPEDKAENLYAVSLMIYQKLVSFSCRDDMVEQYCGMTLLRMAAVYERQNRPDEAVALYRKLMEINPSSADAVYSLGMLYEKLNKWDEALTTWRKFSDGMVEGSPLWYESKYRVSRALAELGEMDKACEVLTITMVLHPDLKDDELTRKYTTLKSRVCAKSE